MAHPATILGWSHICSRVPECPPPIRKATGLRGLRAAGCGLEMLVAVTSCRWHFEHAFEVALQKTGRDNYEVRSAAGWYRHVMQVLQVLLAVMQMADRVRPDPLTQSPQPGSLTAFKRSRGLAGGRYAGEPVSLMAPAADAARDAADSGLVVLVMSPAVLQHCYYRRQRLRNDLQL